MASSKEYVAFIMEQLSNLKEVSARPMMGEYVVYYKDKVIGGIYDDRFLIKNVKEAQQVLHNITYEIPYVNAKEMILVEEVDNPKLLEELILTIYPFLPIRKPRKRKE